jgi:hypothetical protein
MTVEDEIRGHAEQIERLRTRLGILSVSAYVRPGEHGPEPVLVADFDTSRPGGYSDRYFDLMFALQRLFFRPVDMWEKHMFEDDQLRREQLQPVSLSVFRATA